MSDLQRGTISAVGQNLQVRGWMGWEEVEEPSCELRGDNDSHGATGDGFLPAVQQA